MGYTNVTYDGSRPGQVRLYAAVQDHGLASFMTVTVTRGTGRGGAFVADGDGAVFSGPLSEFPTGWTEGVADAGTWDTGGTHTYRFEVRLSHAATAGAVADASFSWEARAA
jgi:hypothetical protein